MLRGEPRRQSRLVGAQSHAQQNRKLPQGRPLADVTGAGGTLPTRHTRERATRRPAPVEGCREPAASSRQPSGARRLGVFSVACDPRAACAVGLGTGTMAAVGADPPVQVGMYRLSRTLGIGSFGKVKREAKLAGPCGSFTSAGQQLIEPPPGAQSRRQGRAAASEPCSRGLQARAGASFAGGRRSGAGGQAALRQVPLGRHCPPAKAVLVKPPLLLAQPPRWPALPATPPPARTSRLWPPQWEST